MKKVLLIVEKEFEEIMKNKLILASILVMPLVFSILIPLTMIGPLLLMPDQVNNTTTQVSSGSTAGDLDSMSKAEMIAYFATSLFPFFMLMPAMIPTIISAYSIIGEKKNRTLEPLLAAPVSVSDIMIGKAISALIPALIATWVSAAIYSVVIWLLTKDIVHRILVPDQMWLLGLLVLAPLLAFMAIMFTIIISARVNDPRTAQQISVIFVLPIVGLFIGQLSGFMTLDITVVGALCIIVLIIDLIVIKIGSKLFDREEILTRWK